MAPAHPPVPPTKHVRLSRPKTTCYPPESTLPGSPAHNRHSLAASIGCTGAPTTPSHQPLTVCPFPFQSQIPVHGLLTLPVLDNGWALVVGVLATPPVITTFYLSAGCRPASAGPAGEPHLPPDRSSRHRTWLHNAAPAAAGQPVHFHTSF